MENGRVKPGFVGIEKALGNENGNEKPLGKVKIPNFVDFVVPTGGRISVGLIVGATVCTGMVTFKKKIFYIYFIGFFLSVNALESERLPLT